MGEASYWSLDREVPYRPIGASRASGWNMAQRPLFDKFWAFPDIKRAR
jgi:hypothetical protein